MDRLKYSGILIVGFFLLFFSIKQIDNLIAKQLIRHDAALLSAKLAMYVNDSASQLLALPTLNKDFQCTAENKTMLEESVFDSTFIRWTAVIEDLTVLCTSQEVTRRIDKLVQHQIGPSMNIAVINHPEAEFHELFLARNAGEYRYVASIVPMNPRYFVPVLCDNCLEYNITIDSVQDELAAVPLVTFGFEEFDGEHAINEVITYQNEYYNAEFTLSGNEDLIQQYRNISWQVNALMGLIVSLLLTLLYSYWRNSFSSRRAQIKHGIAHQEFGPFYQPIIDLQTSKIVGAEVLMRWIQTNGNVMPPNQFIPFAESEGLIVEMTYSMLDVMVTDIDKFGQQLEPHFFSINIVPEHLNSDRFYLYIKGLQESGKLGKHRISLEITERQPIVDLVKARQMLDKFYAIGIDLKLDDAGMGYGGFSYVQNLGISTLKIDKAFIDTIGVKDNFNEKTLDAIISFSDKSGLVVIAEGVETDIQLAYLKAQGVQLAQGYLFSKPLAAKGFFHWNGPKAKW